MEELKKKNKKALSFIAKSFGNLGMSMFFGLLAQILPLFVVGAFLYYMFR